MRTAAQTVSRGRTAKPGSSRLLSFPNLSLIFVFLCCALIGPLRQFEKVISLAMLVVLLLNWKRDEFYLYMAVFLFFREQFYLQAGSTPLYRVYSYLLVLRLFRDFFTLRLRPQFLPVLAIFIVFSVFCTGRLDMRVSMMVLCDVTLAFFTTEVLHQKPALMQKFIVTFVVTAICAGVYSLLAGSFVSYETGIGVQETYTRYYGTVGDANFAGCYYNVALFMAMCSDMFRKWYIRWPTVGILVFFILLTASQTALLCMLIGCCGYVILRYRMAGLPIALMIAFGALLGVLALISIPALRESGPFSTLAKRLLESMQELESGNVNVDSLTTNRTALWRVSWDYFKRLPLYMKLLGGTPITMLLTDEYMIRLMGGAVHQSILQGFLNFGILGTAIIFGTHILQTISNAIKCLCMRADELPVDLRRCMVMTAYVFLLYAQTVDIFMDWRMLLLYFF